MVYVNESRSVITNTNLEAKIDSNFVSSVAIQNTDAVALEIKPMLQIVANLNLELGMTMSLIANLKVKLSITTTLAYTARQNIVLKIKEGLHTGVTIAGIKYDVTQVEGTTDFRGLLTEDQVSGTNAIFVAHSQTKASDNQVLGFNTRQKVEDYFAIFLVTDSNTDEYGVNAMDIIRAMHHRVLEALLNWQLPPTQYDLPTMPLIYRGGNAYGLESDSYYWRDDYSCTSQICSLQAQPMF